MLAHLKTLPKAKRHEPSLPFTSLTVQHLLHGHTNHHISSSTSSSVTSSNTTSTITSTNYKKNKCLFRVSAWVNDLSHCPHGCNFSPVWMSKWVLMLPVCQNSFLHSVQLCGFSPLWWSIYAFSNSQPLCVTLRAGHKDEASPHCKWVNEFSDVQNAEQFFALSASVWLFLDCGRSCASSYLQYN